MFDVTQFRTSIPDDCILEWPGTLSCLEKANDQHKFQGKDSQSLVLSPHMCTQPAGWKSIAFKSESMQKLIANKPWAVNLHWLLTISVGAV